jgi:ribonuclease P protein component
MPEKIYSLTREERLTSKKIIDKIFEEGMSLNAQPFRLLWLEQESSSTFPVQIAFIVPKKIFQKAVIRNLIKRRMRESYRKNKYVLYHPLIGKNIHCSLIILYLCNEILKTREIETHLIQSFHKFLAAIEKRA